MKDKKRISTLIEIFFTRLVPTLIIAAFGLFGSGCSEATSQKPQNKQATPKSFNQYWFQGLAEISRFKLEQARYGQIHTGDAVLIYVTEEFLVDKQVKSEQGKVPGAVSILKLNSVRKFNTGIYPYSMMSSVFTPVDRSSFPQTLKVTTSVQEWCGQTFTQLNFRENQYHILLRSYFMDEADRQYTLDAAQLEDDIWTLIRINPDLLTIGELKLIPGSQFSRLKHVIQAVQEATAALSHDGVYDTYSIKYKNVPRELMIKFKNVFPYEIMEWKTTSSLDRDNNNKVLTTHAVRTHVMLVDYWNKKSPADADLRKKLGLE